MNKIKVALLYGGASYEHEVSLRSALAVYENLDRDMYEVLLVGIQKNGSWHLQREQRVAMTKKFGRILEIVADSEGAIMLDPNRRVLHLRGACTWRSTRPSWFPAARCFSRWCGSRVTERRG